MQDNISVPYYDNFYQITDRRGRPLTNIYWSQTNIDTPSVGTIYLIHGYGGSPIEPCMKIPMHAALKNGFDVVAIEGAALSATYDFKKDVTRMNLARQKSAIFEGLNFCKEMPGINHKNRIAWSHSLSCRALSDMIVAKEPVKSFFNELVLNNPYFLPPSRVIKTRERLMQHDPTGKMWQSALNRMSMQRRQIENIEFKIPTCLQNLTVPLPRDWAELDGNLPSIAKRMSKFVDSLHISFVLGTADDMAEYAQNVQIFNELKVSNKNLISIDGANHLFENKLDEYENNVNIILSRIKTKYLNEK